MARIWITGQKSVTGREYKLAVLCADGCAFRIANPRACIERGLFGAARQFSRRFCIDTPGMKQVERGRRAFQTMRVRQSGAVIFSRVPLHIVTPAAWSRWRSIVSIAPRRTVTENPLPSEISTAAEEAPPCAAQRRMLAEISLSWSCVCGKRGAAEVMFQKRNPDG